MSDLVNHPSHYTDGRYEVIDFIEGWGLGFHLGNAAKYISRAGKKDPGKKQEDLEKAIWYLRRAEDKSINELFVWDHDDRPNIYEYAADKHLSEHLGEALRYIVDGLTTQAIKEIKKEIGENRQ